MIESIKQKSIKSKIQFVEITKEGVIKDTENNLFRLKADESIFDVHPTFEAIQYYFNEDVGSKFELSCINIEIGDVKGIYDINIDILKESVVLTILDFTSHYMISNTLSQEKNESVIQAQLLKEREEFKNRFLANTSHEVRTPLTTIMGFTNILQRSSLTLSQMHYLNVIKSASDQLKTIIDDILDISKIEMGLLTILDVRFDFETFFDYLNDVYNERVIAKGIKFSYKADKKIPKYLIGDKYRLHQILGNILDNALKFTDKGEISIYAKILEHDTDKVKISFEIKDTGLGIEESEFETIFDSFYQTALPENNSAGGTGLGLSIVKNLVDLMDGSITVNSKPKLGTKFTVNLSFKICVNQDSVKSINDLVIGQSMKAKKYNILIAEDLEENQLLLMRILTDMGDYYFDIANNGDQVIEYLHKNTYDLILMDLKMPTMDGYDTTRFIRESPIKEIKNVPIIAVTAKVSTLERDKCLKYGMNEYIGKPFTEDEFISKIKDILK